MYGMYRLATMRNVTNRPKDRQTDGRTDNSIMPIADHFLWQYDWLK